VHTFAKSLINQYRLSPVHILLVSPGTMKTNFFARIGVETAGMPRFVMGDPRRVAQAILSRLKSRPNGHLIPGLIPKFMYLTNRVLPPSIAMGLWRVFRNLIRIVVR